MNDLDTAKAAAIFRKERWLSSFIRLPGGIALYILAGATSHRLQSFLLLGAFITPLVILRSKVRRQIPNEAHTWQLQHGPHWPIIIHLIQHLLITLALALALWRAPWITPGRFLVGLWGGFYLGSATLWTSASWLRSWKTHDPRAQRIHLVLAGYRILIGVCLAVCGSLWGALMGAAVTGALYWFAHLEKESEEAEEYQLIRVWRMSSGWDETQCRKELLRVIPRTWQTFVSAHGNEKIVGFALFSAVEHGYIILSGFTEEGMAASDPDDPWWPPESPHYDLLTLSEEDFPLATDSVRQKWMDEMSQARVSDLSMAKETHREYATIFLNLAVDVLRELRESGAFGTDPALVLLAVDAESYKVDDDIVRQLNKGPAWDRYQRTGQPKRSVPEPGER